MNTDGLYSVKAPTSEEQARFQARVNEIGFAEASIEFVKQHADRLMSGDPVAVVEVPRVVDLELWRERRET